MSRALAIGRALLLAGAVAACGPARATRVSVDSSVDVHVRIEPTPDSLPFDPRGARLLAASRQLGGLVDHGVEFRVDAALVADLRSEFERQLIVAIEDLVRALTELRDSNTAEFTRTTGALTEVECRYSVLVRDASAKFEKNALRIELPAHISKLAPTWVVREAFDIREDTWLDAHFSSVEPESVAAGEQQAYFHWLTHTRPGYGSIWEWRHAATSKPDSVARTTDNPHGEVVTRIVRLYTRLESSHSPVLEPVRAWLFEQLSWLSYQYQQAGDAWQSYGKGTALRRGERALCEWLTRALPQANADERLIVLTNLYPSGVPDAYPGIDRFAFGLSAADAWIAAGKPGEGGESSQAKWMDQVVCPTRREPDGARDRSRSCRPEWLLFAVRDAGNRRKLAAALDVRDAELTEQLFANLKYESSESIVALFRLLDPKRPAMSAALRSFAEVLVNDRRGAAEEVAKSVWHDLPERRGDALYILASAHGHDRTDSDYTWGRFQEQYGEPIRERDLAGFLDHGLPAFLYLPPMWPALGKGFSRVQPIAERLDLLLPDATQPAASESIRTLSELLSRLCDGKSEADLVVLHRSLEARATAHPPERTALVTLLHDSAKGGCASRKKGDLGQ